MSGIFKTQLRKTVRKLLRFYIHIDTPANPPRKLNYPLTSTAIRSFSSCRWKYFVNKQFSMACCKRAMLCETGRQPSHRFSLILFDNTKISPQHVRMSHPLNCLFIGGMDGNRYPFRLPPDKVLQEVSQFRETAHRGRQSQHRTASRSSSEHSQSSQAVNTCPSGF